MIGGMTSWVGPIIGAVLLGTLQQLATVTISSALNLLIVGVLLVVFVIIAPNGIVGLVQDAAAAREAQQAHDRAAPRGRRVSASASAALSRSKASISTSQPGERLGLIGPNGSGKSTLVNCLCGTLHNDTGTVRFDGAPLDGLPAHQRTRLGLARSFQLPKPFRSLNVADNLRVPLLYTVNARARAASALRASSTSAATSCCR